MLLDRLHRPVRGVRLVHREPNAKHSAFRVQIVPLRRLTSNDVERLQRQLADTDGPIVTSALGTREQQPFLERGFEPRESLFLLHHDLQDVGTTGGPAEIRGARRSDIDDVLRIDHQGFDEFWAFDRQALSSARRATPRTRYVVATIDQRVVGYAITGHADSTAYLQRLGVDTAMQRTGIGSQLVRDALGWAKWSEAHRIFVNTQEINTPARRLYESHGFVINDERLTVLEWLR